MCYSQIIYVGHKLQLGYPIQTTSTIFSKVPLEQCLEVSILNNILYLFIYHQILIFDGFYDNKSSKLYGAGKVL